jgi:hypothetical protein
MPQECAAQPGLWRMTLRQSGIPWRLLSDIDDEPLVGRGTLHMPNLAEGRSCSQDILGAQRS